MSSTAPAHPSPATVGAAPSWPAGIALRPGAKPERLMSLDAYRGFIMFMLAGAGFGAVQMARKFPDSAWSFWANQFSHTPWQWGVFWDLIMPAFMLMVGVAMPLSYARRQEAGDTFGRQLRHAIVRAVVLCVLGSALMTQNARFVNVLTQIGLGYVFVFLLLRRSPRFQLGAIAVILTGHWLLFASYPTPGPGYDFAAAGANPADLLPGFWAHWSKNVSLSADFDRWLLNLFPNDKLFVNQVGSTTTLNFIPAMANMILGVMSGQVLMSARPPGAKFAWLVRTGAVCLVLGIVAGLTICPVIKRIWTPSFALYSSGWTLWMLAAFYWVIDLRGYKRWAFPLLVFGANSLAIYVMTLLWPAWIKHALAQQWGAGIFSGPYGPVWERAAVLIVLWLFCWWLYRRKLFFRI
jgi:predicted acyltransferase